MAVVALLLGAGAGVRLNAGVAKALVTIGDRTILDHAFDALTADPRIARILVTAPAEQAAVVAHDMAGRAVVIAGGRTRQESVRLGLAALDPAEDDIVLVHDAARPFVPVAVIDRVVAAVAAGADAAVPALPVSDTIKRIGPDGSVVGTLERSELRAVQTPQGFRARALAEAHRYAVRAGLQDVSDDAGLVERHGGRVVLVGGAEEAFKITNAWDLQLAEVVLRQRTQATQPASAAQ
jgi:2-C-methyl-D-erythritol 4-phosphate cytidylyltransferase